MLKMWKRSVALVVILLLTLSTAPAASAQVPFVGMGDSIGEGVQSGDASESTQPFNFLNLIALRLGTSFPLPLIRTGIFGIVGDTSSRSRINPNVAGLDRIPEDALAVLRLKRARLPLIEAARLG